MESGLDVKNKKDLEIYIHIPFCLRKCLYCDFLSAPADKQTQEAYMEALMREITGRAGDYGDYRVLSVFIGGGTPSVIEPEMIARVLACIRDSFSVAQDAEITMEVNPGTVEEHRLQIYKEAGINRLSIGLQSADDEELQKLGRIHSWADFYETYMCARRVGFRNMNVDLMAALPGQTLETYRNTLKKVCSLDPAPEHISAYSLIIEEGTPFAGMAEEGRLALPDEDTDRRMYEETEKILTEYGYERYEISNYAKEGYACRHNIGYWTGVSYLGFGIGAASLIDEQRFRNGESLNRYMENPLDCREDWELLTEREQMEEFCFLGLRMTKGISYKDFYQKFQVSLQEIYGEVIEKNVREGLLAVWPGEKIALTSKGLDLANYVMAQFLLED